LWLLEVVEQDMMLQVEVVQVVLGQQLDFL
jgi:hypothetical protein